MASSGSVKNRLIHMVLLLASHQNSRWDAACSLLAAGSHLPSRWAGRSQLARPNALRSVNLGGLIWDGGGSAVKDQRSNFLFGLIPDGKIQTGAVPH